MKAEAVVMNPVDNIIALKGNIIIIFVVVVYGGYSQVEWRAIRVISCKFSTWERRRNSGPISFQMST